MVGTKDYDAVASNNDSPAPNGAPEGMPAASVNNVEREIMANVKAGPYVVADLTALKALDSLKQATGNQISLTGLVTAGTSGGIFRYDSASSATADDIDIVEPTDTLGRWLRVEPQIQPAFSAFMSVDDVNATGDGTVVTIIFDTEISDPRLIYNSSTGVTTAIKAGTYNVKGNIGLQGLLAANAALSIKIESSNRTYTKYALDPFAMSDVGFLYLPFSADVDMDLNDTFTITVKVTGGTKVVDIDGAADLRTSLSASLTI